MFPQFAKLTPTTIENVDGELDVPKCVLQFSEWRGEPIKNDYNGKPVVEFNGEPLFAELAILRLYESNGWAGRWVDAWGGRYLTGLPESSKNLPLPKAQEAILRKISAPLGGWKGRWDVFVWNDKNEMLFIELKRRSKDRMRSDQIQWLRSALYTDIPLTNFLIVEWDFPTTIKL